MIRWLLVVALCALCTPSKASDWFPFPVLADGRALSYEPLRAARKGWRICALLPHARDRYWWGVAWGLDQEAARLGVRLGIYEAGGYEFLPRQREQLAECRRLNADAYVLAAIDVHGLCDEVTELRRRDRPVIDLVNRVECAGISARSQVNFADMTRAAVEYVLARSPGQPLRIGWLPGPQDAGWVMDSERGLWQTLHGQPVTLEHGGYAPVDRSSQATLARKLLKDNPDLDYVIGNAEAAAVATQLVQHWKLPAQVVALYATEGVVELIRGGQVLAAPTDSPVIQARVAIDLAVRELEDRRIARVVSPRIEMLDVSSLRHFDLRRISPPGGQWMIRQGLPE